MVKPLWAEVSGVLQSGRQEARSVKQPCVGSLAPSLTSSRPEFSYLLNGSINSSYLIVVLREPLLRDWPTGNPAHSIHITGTLVISI